MDPKVTRGVPHRGGVGEDHVVDPQVIGRQIEEDVAVINTDFTSTQMASC